MPIPSFTAEGLLPEGVHDCTLAEVEERFGRFQTTDVRCRLFERLETYVREAAATGLIVAVIVDGSFVTAKDSPNDIDLIVVVRAGHDFFAELRPFQYNVIARRQVSRRLGFDMLLVEEGEFDSDDAIGFFPQVGDSPGIRKGMLKVRL